MPTRTVVITDLQQELIDSLVESWRYQDASEVLRDGSHAPALPSIDLARHTDPETSWT